MIPLWVWAFALQTNVGFVTFTVPDPGHEDISAAAWYPAIPAGHDTSLGFYHQVVAVGGMMTPGRHPLVLISHGTGGWLGTHYDTARELADAGFVVVAFTHPHDNSQDPSATGSRRNLIDRPRQLLRVLDFVIRAWALRDHVDASRVGVFGHSLGAYTVLVAAGGVPDFAQLGTLCRVHPMAPECAFVRQYQGNRPDTTPPPSEWPHDSRIKAVVIAAPALGFVFGDSGLKHVRAPVSLWVADQDTMAPREWNSDVVARSLPSPPEVHAPQGSNHFSFLAPCTPALARAVPFICMDADGFDRTAFHEGFDADVVQFFREHLR